MKTVAQ